MIGRVSIPMFCRGRASPPLSQSRHRDKSVTPIPADAVEGVIDTYETGGKMRTKYLVDGEEVGWRFWMPDGELGMEWEMRNGMRHGRFKSWNEGKLFEEGFYLDDKEHGEHKQYDANGNH